MVGVPQSNPSLLGRKDQFVGPGNPVREGKTHSLERHIVEPHIKEDTTNEKRSQDRRVDIQSRGIVGGRDQGAPCVRKDRRQKRSGMRKDGPVSPQTTSGRCQCPQGPGGNARELKQGRGIEAMVLTNKGNQ